MTCQCEQARPKRLQDIISFDSVQALRDGHHEKTDSPVVCKPDPLCYKLAMYQAGLQAASTDDIVFLDDSVRNIQAARAMGFFTVLVGRNNTDVGHISVSTVPELYTSFSQLFDDPTVMPWTDSALPCRLDSILGQ
jgi:FMN phosphatase YigB (HAD superfamily)